MMVLAFVGSFCGALLASRIPREAFEPIVLIAVGAFVLVKPTLGEATKLR